MTDTDALTFYFSPGSSSMATHIALHEIGAAFEPRPVKLYQETQSPDFLAVNPLGKVPTLLIGGRPLTEVAAILFYLARRFPEAELMPQDDLEAQAQIVSWMSFAASTIHPARKQGPEHARAVFTLADDRLGERPWVVGEYSIADIHLFRLFWRFGVPLDDSAKAFPNLHRHYDQMMARPAVQKTIAIEQAIGYAL